MEDLTHTLESLIQEGERLAPHGGDIVDGYNGKMQSDYVAWRLQAISAIEDLEERGQALLKDIYQDKQSSYFYRSSASRILVVHHSDYDG